MPKNFQKEISALYPNDPELKKQRAILAEVLLEEDPDLKEKLSQKVVDQGKKEWKAQGEQEALQKMLVLKLGQALAPDEESRLEDELRRIGTLGVAQLILASDKKALLAWLSPKAPPIPKPTKAKK